MTAKAFFSILTSSALATAFVVLWPAACARSATPLEPVAGATPGQVLDAEHGPTTYLPHPAFAYANNDASGSSISDIAEKALPSVVNISSSRKVSGRSHPFFNDPFFRRFFGPGTPRGERQESGLGSGVIVSKAGVVLTNSHVVERADTIQVTTSDGREFDAEIVGTDKKSDLAVLKLKGDTSGLTPVEFADSSRLRLGDIVLAIGNPFGVGQTVTMGIVSAKGRADVGIVDYEDFIQTDAAINPGNSGGALISMEGKLVGINTAILSRSGGYMGIGFAIPSNMAKPISQSLLQHGKVVRGWLGVAIQDLNADLAKAMNLKVGSGVLISDVEPGGPAAKAGIQRGDVVVAIDGRKVDSTGRLRNVIAQGGAGRNVKVDLLRAGKSKTVSVMLGELPGAEKASAAGPGGKDGALDGLTLRNLNADTRSKFKIPSSVKSGVVVVSVQRGSVAARAGLRPGDVILELNKKRTADVGSFKRAYKSTKQRALLLVSRDGHTIFMVLKR